MYSYIHIFLTINYYLIYTLSPTNSKRFFYGKKQPAKIDLQSQEKVNC